MWLCLSQLLLHHNPELENISSGVSIWELVVALGMKREWGTHQKSLHLPRYLIFSLDVTLHLSWSPSCNSMKSKCDFALANLAWVGAPVRS